jgi:flagellar motor component MotA
MTNNTTTNETLETLETVSESGILDSLADNPELALLGVLVAALGAYAAYTIPAVRTFAHVYLNKFMNKYDTQIMELLDKHLSKAQRKAFDKLDEAAQKHVKDEVLRNIVLTFWDEHDDDLAKKVKSEVRGALNSVK